jgi:hypothetical protein
MPGSPLRIACVRPAPKSRFVVTGLAWGKINGESGSGSGSNGKRNGKRQRQRQTANGNLRL